MEFSKDIPCTDCAQWKQTLEDNDYEVIACDATAGDFCRIRYRHKAGGAVALASAGHVAAVPMMATAMAAASGLMTHIQEMTAKAIVNIFETSEVLGDYSAVTVLPMDTGHLSYGRSQTTLGSGNLHVMLQRYCSNGGARFSERLRKWLPRIEEKDFSLDDDERLKNLLRACADDPVMRDVQDRFFDQFYWIPAVSVAATMGVVLPLSICVIYDSHVHGSWGRVKALTDGSGPAFAAEGEQAWMRRYVRTRRAWLAAHANSLLHSTVYRMDALERLMDQGHWGLPLPLLVRDREISLATLLDRPRGCYDGPQPGTRSLAVQPGFQRGLDVRLLQLALSDLGADILADGVYGSTSARKVREYQGKRGLPATGVADPALIADAMQAASGVD